MLKTRDSNGVTEMGLKSDSFLGCEIFGTGTTVECFHMEGTPDCDKDRLNR